MKKIGLVIALMASPTIAFAHAITAEQRREKIEFNEKMAERYHVAAECLKSGKPLDDCNLEAMKGCPMMGKDCPFMDKAHMDKETMREHMKKMKDKTESTDQE